MRLLLPHSGLCLRNNNRICHQHLLTQLWKDLDYPGLLQESHHNHRSATNSNLDTEYNILLVRYWMWTLPPSVRL